jgi:hypothetical protein
VVAVLPVKVGVEALVNKVVVVVLVDATMVAQVLVMADLLEHQPILLVVVAVAVALLVVAHVQVATRHVPRLVVQLAHLVAVQLVHLVAVHHALVVAVLLAQMVVALLVKAGVV